MGLGVEEEKEIEEKFNPKKQKIEKEHQENYRALVSDANRDRKVIRDVLLSLFFEISLLFSYYYGEIVKLTESTVPDLDDKAGVKDNDLLREHRFLEEQRRKNSAYQTSQISNDGKYSRPIPLLKPGESVATEKVISFAQLLEGMDRDWNEQRLKDLLIYVRSKYFYCFYCGSVYDSYEQLEKLCPGLYEEAH